MRVADVYDGTTGNTNNSTSPAITTVTANSAIVCLWGSNDSRTSEVTAVGAPSGYTLGSSSIGGFGRGTAVAYLLDAGVAATESPGAWTHTSVGSTADTTTTTLALRNDTA